jgi:hypothetical protein
MTSIMLRARRLIPTAVALGVISNAAIAEPSNQWRIEFDEKVATDGMIVLNVLPIGGTPVRIETRVPAGAMAGAMESNVAHLVRDALQVKLGAAYTVEVDDGEPASMTA